jgi:hypothetical protein
MPAPSYLLVQVTLPHPQADRPNLALQVMTKLSSVQRQAQGALIWSWGDDLTRRPARATAQTQQRIAHRNHQIEERSGSSYPP